MVKLAQQSNFPREVRESHTFVGSCFTPHFLVLISTDRSKAMVLIMLDLFLAV